LSQLKDARFKSFSAQDGLAGDFSRPVYEDRQGALWIGGQEGVSRYKNGTFTTWTRKDGLPYKDIDAIGEDNEGGLWFGTRTGGLSRFWNGRFRAWTTRDGLASDKVFSIHRGRAGNLWIWQNGAFTTWATKDGLATRNVESFYMDQRGTLWIGTRGDGLCRFRDGKFVTITRKDGLHDDTAYQILSDTEDDSGNLWVRCNRGVYRVSLKDLNEFADGHRQSVTSFAYGVADGMLSRECNGGQPAGWKTRDGRLWFPTLRGVVALDPQPYNPHPSRVVIEGATLAGATPRGNAPIVTCRGRDVG
jgi:ligand-binding sensor domain-containing protein